MDLIPPENRIAMITEDVDFDSVDEGLVPLELLLLFIPLLDPSRRVVLDQLQGVLRPSKFTLLGDARLYGLRYCNQLGRDRIIVWDTQSEWGVDGEDSVAAILHFLEDNLKNPQPGIKLPHVHAAGVLLCLAQTSLDVKMEKEKEKRATLMGDLD
ncbi:hypothetical protein FRC03_012214 [Tulasnella sp. 419]|nr:hypothetical protein FRC03_012214 [Tulasnella sp. 419]